MVTPRRSCEITGLEFWVIVHDDCSTVSLSVLEQGFSTRPFSTAFPIMFISEQTISMGGICDFLMRFYFER